MSYQTDFYGWAFEQAQRVRNGESIDRDNIAEELEDLGRAEKRELTKHLARLMQHLLKCEYQPSKRTRSWDATIREQRKQAVKTLSENPSLKPKLAECVADAYDTARNFAAAEMEDRIEEDLPRECPWSVEYLLRGTEEGK